MEFLDRWAGIDMATDADDATRRRGLVVVALFYAVCTMILSGHGFATEGFTITRLVGIGATLLFFVVFALARRLASITVPAALMIAINYVGGLFYVLLTGGATGPGCILFIGVPFLAAFLLSARVAVAFAALTLATLWLVFGLVPAPPGIDKNLVGPMIISTVISVTTLYSLSFEALSRRLADRLRASLADAEAASEAKSRFLAMMSHELRTPMNGVIGMADVLAGTDLDAEQREYVRTITSSGGELLTIINDLLDFTKMEAGHTPLCEAPYEPDAVIEQVCLLLRPEAEAKGVALTRRVDPAVPAELVGDDGKVRQILLNLVANAVKFTADGAVSLRVRPAGEAILFEVEDTGVGIAEDKLEMIFDPFQQAEADTTRTYGGTGLGLSISRQLAEAMSGSLDVASEPGRGSVFTLRLPRAVPSAARPPVATAAPVPASAPVPTAPGTRRLLVAEDNPVNRQVIAAMLTGAGWDTVFAEDGAEACEHHAAAGPGGFGAVLMDINMPRMNGYDAARAIRAREADGWPRAYIAALTAHSGADAEERTLAAGMDRHVAKPLRRDELTAVLARAAEAAEAASSRRPALRRSA